MVAQASERPRFDAKGLRFAHCLGYPPHFPSVRVASILIHAIYDVLRGPRSRIVELETKLAPRALAKFAARGTPIVMLCGLQPS